MFQVQLVAFLSLNEQYLVPFDHSLISINIIIILALESNYIIPGLIPVPGTPPLLPGGAPFNNNDNNDNNNNDNDHNNSNNNNMY